MKRSAYLAIVGAALLASLGCKPASQIQENAVTPPAVGQALPSGTTASVQTPAATGQVK